jgi:hypothetical protein
MNLAKVKTTCETDADLKKELDNHKLYYLESYYDDEYDGRLFVGYYSPSQLLLLDSCSFVKKISIDVSLNTSGCDHYVQQFMGTAKQDQKFTVTVTYKNGHKDVTDCTARKIDALLRRDDVLRVAKFSATDKKQEHKKVCKCVAEFLEKGHGTCSVEVVCHRNAKEAIERKAVADYGLEKLCYHCFDPMYFRISATKEQLTKIMQEPFVNYITGRGTYNRCKCPQELTYGTKFDYYVKNFVDTADEKDTCIVAICATYEKEDGETRKVADVEKDFDDAKIKYRYVTEDHCSQVYAIGRYTAKELLQIEKDIKCVDRISASGLSEGVCWEGGTSDISNCSPEVQEFIINSKKYNELSNLVTMNILVTTNLHLTPEEEKKFLTDNFKNHSYTDEPQSHEDRFRDRWIVRTSPPKIVSSNPMVLSCEYEPESIERLCLRSFVVAIN